MGIGTYLSSVAPYLIYFLGIIAVLVSIFKAEWGILFLIPILPLETLFEKIKGLPLGKDFIDIMLIALIIGWASKAFSRRRSLIERSVFNIPLILLFFYTFFSLYVGSGYLKDFSLFDIHNPRLQTWKNYMILPLIYFIVLNNIREKKYLKWLVFLMLGVILLMSIKFFRNYRWIDKSFFRDQMRWNGPFSYLGPNEYAAFFSHYIFIALGLLLMVKEKLKRLFFSTIVLFNLYCIVFLFSRGSYLATYFTVALAGILRKNALIVFFVLMLFISWHTLLPKSVVERIQMTTNEYNELDASNEKRVDVWKSSLDLFNTSPFVGIGFNTFPYLGLILGDTHNLYIKILLEEGIYGFLIFILIILLSLFSGWKLYKKADDNILKGLGLGFVLCTISLLISNFFGDRWTYIPLGAYYWAFMGLVIRANIITQQEIKNKVSNSKKLKTL